jgi:hypothetical protein
MDLDSSLAVSPGAAVLGESSERTSRDSQSISRLFFD